MGVLDMACQPKFLWIYLRFLFFPFKYLTVSMYSIIKAIYLVISTEVQVYIPSKKKRNNNLLSWETTTPTFIGVTFSPISAFTKQWNLFAFLSCKAKSGNFLSTCHIILRKLKKKLAPQFCQWKDITHSITTLAFINFLITANMCEIS